MVQAGIVHHVATEDMDALTFKSSSLLRRLTMPEARKLPVQEISYEKVMKMIDLTHEQFVDLCILLGLGKKYTVVSLLAVLEGLFQHF